MEIKRGKIEIHGEWALKRLRAALVELQKCDDECTSEDFKYYKWRVAEIISCDHGEAGLEHLVSAFRYPLPPNRKPNSTGR